MKEIIITLNIDQVNLILFALMNAPIAAAQSIPVKELIEKQGNDQLNINNE